MIVSSSPREAGNRAVETRIEGFVDENRTAMTPDRWAVAERLYHEALTRPVHGRVAFLAEACAADEALRHEVESLLAQSAPNADFLEEPAIALAAKRSSAPGVSLLTGRRIGVYD